MKNTLFVVAVTAATALACVAAPAPAQGTTHPTPHIVTVKLIERGGSAPYVFEPASVAVERGDTLRFIQGADTPHNVHFTSEPKGAKLGNAISGPYLVAKGQTYDLVIDGRFPDGNYSFVCEPHEMIGMRGAMTVVSGTTTTASK